MNKAEEAVPFITYKEKEGFKLNVEAETFLRELNPSRKVAVISIVGKYRTGKSFFVNRVLLNKSGKKAGFSVGPTINPCTKGLWLWKECLQCEETKEEIDVILLDTEGFGGMDENQTHDSKIFLFALLLSSYFIYNSQGNIDEPALNNIQLIINLAKDIRPSDSNNTEATDPADFFPSFLWVVRDFALQMVDAQGQKITAKEYLEKALENQKGVSDAIEQKNRIRRQLKHFFKDRDCSTLVRPIEAEADLQRLNELTNEELRVEFVQQMTQLRKRIFKKIRPKEVNGQPLNGSQLIEICKAYIHAINSGSLPNIENAWKYMCKNESLRAVEECLAELKASFNAFLSSENDTEKNPIESHQLEELKNSMRVDLFKNFKQKSISASEEELKEHFDQLDHQFSKQFKEFKKLNKQKLQEYFEELCSDRKKEIEERLKNDGYADYFEFSKDLQDFRDCFEQSVNRSAESEEFFEQVSAKLYRLAAETIGQKVSRQSDKDKRIYESRCQQLEADIERRKIEWEQEHSEMTQRIQSLEKERAQLLANEHFAVERLIRVTAERDRADKQIESLLQNQKQVNIGQSEENQEKLFSLQRQIQADATAHIKAISSLETQIALLTQENAFNQKEIQRLHEEIERTVEDCKLKTQELAFTQTTIQYLQGQINQLEISKNNEISLVKAQFGLRSDGFHSTSLNESVRAVAPEQHEIEKTYLKNQVSLLNSQLEENKKLHDALISAIQQGGNQKEGVDATQQQQQAITELNEKNRKLQVSANKFEAQSKEFERKLSKLKSYKKMIKNSISLQCISCSKFIPTRQFLQHIDTCNFVSSPKPTLHDSSSTQSIQSISQVSTTSNQSQNQKQSAVSNQTMPHPIFDPASFSIIISQTIVRESSDHKPYTEYVIQISKTPNHKWQVSRKYKNFCELHHTIAMQFPNLRFPESSLAIISAQSDLDQGVSFKRPALIEERRRALQLYIKDLSKLDLVFNSKAFRSFLEIDKNFENQTSQLKTQQPVLLNASMSQKSILNQNHISYNHQQHTSPSHSNMGSINQQNPRGERIVSRDQPKNFDKENNLGREQTLQFSQTTSMSNHIEFEDDRKYDSTQQQQLKSPAISTNQPKKSIMKPGNHSVQIDYKSLGMNSSRSKSMTENEQQQLLAFSSPGTRYATNLNAQQQSIPMQPKRLQSPQNRFSNNTNRKYHEGDEEDGDEFEQIEGQLRDFSRSDYHQVQKQQQQQQQQLHQQQQQMIGQNNTHHLQESQYSHLKHHQSMQHLSQQRMMSPQPQPQPSLQHDYRSEQSSQQQFSSNQRRTWNTVKDQLSPQRSPMTSPSRMQPQSHQQSQQQQQQHQQSFTTQQQRMMNTSQLSNLAPTSPRINPQLQPDNTYSLNYLKQQQHRSPVPNKQVYHERRQISDVSNTSNSEPIYAQRPQHQRQQFTKN